MYSNVSHSVAAVFGSLMDSAKVARDQEVDIPTQLSLGVRLLQGQAHVSVEILHGKAIKRTLKHV